jgi:hypothetical protein
MSDTPETDELAVGAIGFYSCATVPADFARRLERERDEARSYWLPRRNRLTPFTLRSAGGSA